MYERYCRRKSWTVERLEERMEGSGLRSCVLRIEGAAAVLHGEAGCHSIQHKTRSRRQDRIHTSTVTVAVFDAAELDRRAERLLRVGEVRIDTFRGHGAGGQHRNVTDSAVRAVHLPTGETATLISGRSQAQNRERVLEVLTARLASKAEAAHQRRLQGKRREQTRAEQARTVRVYDLIRDMVRCDLTARKVKRVKRILDGDLDLLLK
jgi:peptide chain release factor 1